MTPSESVPATMYADRFGFSVFPVWGIEEGACACPAKGACDHAGKHPITGHGFKDATTAPARIAAWWAEHPNANIGIATGGPSAVWVLDCDGDEGAESLRALEAAHGPLPTCPQVLTGRGCHYYFQHDSDAPVGCRTGVRPGIDVRGDGGYAILPPSRHLSGREYAWEVSADPAETPFPSAPEWLLALVRSPVCKSPSGLAGEGSCIPEGKRNGTLTSLAGSMRRAGMTGEGILAALSVENSSRCVPPLGVAEVRKIAHSVSRYAPSAPRFTAAPEVPDEPLPWISGKDLADVAGEEVEWIAEGLLARTVITEMSAPPKVGKTTFAAHAIGAIIDGRPFLGRRTVKSRVLYLSEERRATIRRAFKRAGILGREEVSVLLLGDVVGRSWADIAAAVTQRANEVGATLVVSDTTSRWAGLRGDAENDAGAAAEALRPLEAVASAGLSVLSLRHERKSGGELGQSARGSSAFTGGADIVLRLQKANAQSHPGRRLLEGTGRLEEVPESIVIELGPGGYEALGDSSEVERKAAREWLLDNLPGANDTPMALQDIRAAYQAAEGKEMARSTLQRALAALQEAHQAEKIPRSAGKSGKADGYRLSDVPNYGGAPGQEGRDHGSETPVPSDLPRPTGAGQSDGPHLPRPTPIVGQEAEKAEPMASGKPPGWDEEEHLLPEAP